MSAQLSLDLTGADPAIVPLSEELDWDRGEWRVTYHVKGHRSSRVIEASGPWAARSKLLRILPGAQILDCRFEG